MKSNKFSQFITTGVLFAVVSSGAYANDNWIGDQGDNWYERIVSTKTRAQVLAELKEAREQGLIVNGETDYPPLPVAKSTRSRAEVRAEAAKVAKNTNHSMDYLSGQ